MTRVPLPLCGHGAVPGLNKHPVSMPCVTSGSTTHKVGNMLSTGSASSTILGVLLDFLTLGSSLGSSALSAPR